MISTIEIKAALRSVFEIGNGLDVILILGSCRAVPYLNYLDRYNRSAGEPFKIFYIEPFNYHWDEKNQRVDIHEELAKLETSERILSILKSATIFIHEHYGNYDLFNTDRTAGKNIYQFGMAAPIDISIPNWNDHFILYNDFEDFGGVPQSWSELGEKSVQKFIDLCAQTSFPEMGDHFRDTWRTTRFFWRPNHISAAFSLYIFRLMNEKFLKLELTDEFWAGAGQEDLFKDPRTQVTQQDRDAYKITWKA